MDSEDDMHDANDAESLDDYYSGDTALGYSDDEGGDYEFMDNDSDDSNDIVASRLQQCGTGLYLTLRGVSKWCNTILFIALIVRRGVEDSKDFRSISLLGGAYKLLVKVLTTQLKEVLIVVVSESQNGFVEGKQI
ncbi:hypothetical protein CsSME_00019906 [Camellia sinensis var. sinensis]